MDTIEIYKYSESYNIFVIRNHKPYFYYEGATKTLANALVKNLITNPNLVEKIHERENEIISWGVYNNMNVEHLIAEGVIYENDLTRFIFNS